MTFSTGNVHISEFSILGLHGNKNIRLKLEDNTLILVGENGTHKTTILTLFYSFLAGDVEGLAKYEFDSLEMVINGKSYKCNSQDVRNLMLSIEDLDSLGLSLSMLPLSLRQSLKEGKKIPISLEALQALLMEEGAPPRYIGRLQNRYSHLKTNKLLSDTFDIRTAFKEHPYHFLYLPTYRRIEEELQNIHQRSRYSDERRRDRYDDLVWDDEQRTLFDTEDSLVCQKLVAFGMKDIQKLWDDKLKELKEQATQGVKALDKGYVEDLLLNKHDAMDQNVLKDLDETHKQRVLDRIKQEETLSTALQQELEKLLSGETNNKQVIYFFKKRYELYVKLFEYEESLKALCTACNRYLHSNEIVFDPTKLDVYIRNRKTSENAPEQRIKLSQLSSGEKQLVSLFTHLYLAEGKQYFVIIDEPEISLSVEWQKTFLQDIRNGTFCSGLFVATHSPFMFANDLLRPYAYGVREFLEEVEDKEA